MILETRASRPPRANQKWTEGESPHRSGFKGIYLDSMTMGKKILYIAGTILEIAFIASAFVLGWLPRAKLGFNRWVVHLNRS